MIKTLMVTLLTLTYAMMPSLFSETLATVGQGSLSRQKGQLVLHVKGTPYEMGYQHGVLLKSQIQRNISLYIDKKENGSESLPSDRIQSFLSNIPQVLSHTPARFIEEMKGMAVGSGIPFEKIVVLNLFPEMFHCSGITVQEKASADHSLYHVRILDYSIGKNLQSTAVLIVAEPENGIAFCNISYAGFIGSVTGMNKQKISIGEIGGQGYGHWDGVPMAFLMRQILEQATSLEEAKGILSSSPRTCEYYYVVSDGKIEKSFGCYATTSQVQFIEAGTQYAMFAGPQLPANYEKNGMHDKFFIAEAHLVSSPYQQSWAENNGEVVALFHAQPKDTLLLTGFSHPERYPVLAERIMQQYGKLEAYTLMEVIRRPVSRESNLHNVIFHPSTLEIWVAHAGPNNEPACDQPYFHFSLEKLIQSDPDSESVLRSESAKG